MERLKGVRRAAAGFGASEEGLTTVEYALAAALVSAALVLTFTELGLAVAAQIVRMTQVIS